MCAYRWSTRNRPDMFEIRPSLVSDHLIYSFCRVKLMEQTCHFSNLGSFLKKCEWILFQGTFQWGETRNSCRTSTSSWYTLGNPWFLAVSGMYLVVVLDNWRQFASIFLIILFTRVLIKNRLIHIYSHFCLYRKETTAFQTACRASFSFRKLILNLLAGRCHLHLLSLLLYRE